MSATGGGRALVISQYYPPEVGFITPDVARALARHARVTVVTAHPSYPHGRFAAGTRWWTVARSVEDGVTVWRVPHLPDHSSSKLRRLVSYLSFALVAGIVAPFVAGRPRAVWVYQTPFTAALAALFFRWVYGSRIVYTGPDLWPESLLGVGVAREGALVRMAYAFSRWINRRADHVICSTRGMLERYAADGMPRERLSFVPIWPAGGISPAGAADPAPAAGPPRVVYAGNLGPAQQLDTVVRAAAQLHREGVEVAFDFYGAGGSEAELRALAAELGAENVTFHGTVPPERAFAACCGAFAQVVSLRSTPLFRMTIPSKLFFAFAAGAPVLYGLEGEAAALAQASGGGVPFRSDDPRSLVEAVRGLLRVGTEERVEMKGALRRYFDENFERTALLERYEALILGAEAPARARAPGAPHPSGR